MVKRILRKADRCCEKSIKEGNGESSFNIWRDHDNFSRDRKHNQLLTIDLQKQQP